MRQTARRKSDTTHAPTPKPAASRVRPNNISLPQNQPKPRPVKICVGCGTPFQTKTSTRNANYCSQACAARTIGRATIKIAKAAQPRGRRAEKWLVLTCPVCQTTYEKELSQVKTYGAGYCSRKCLSASSDARRKALETRIANGNLSAATMYSKAKRGWRETKQGRIFFRSRMEANYAFYLDFLGIVWEYEPKTFWFVGIKRGTVSYTPDFYVPAEKRYVELKGWMDERSATKLKRMAKYHPEIQLDLVDWPQYKEIARKFAKLIPCWEFD